MNKSEYQLLRKCINRLIEMNQNDMKYLTLNCIEYDMLEDETIKAGKLYNKILKMEEESEMGEINEIDRNKDGKISLLEKILWGFEILKEIVTTVIKCVEDKKKEVEKE